MLVEMDLIADLLKASLLEALGDDAGRADKLRAASTVLGARLAGDERAFTPHALLGAVADLHGGAASVLDSAHEVLIEQWETLANAFPSRPDELLRAVLLGGVAHAAEARPGVRLAAWYTLRSALETGEVGRWSVPLTKLLEEWRVPLQHEVDRLWRSASASAALRMPSVSEPESFVMNSRTEIIARAETVQNSGNWQTVAAELQQTYAQDTERLIKLAEGAGLAGSKRAVAEFKKVLTELGSKLRDALEIHERGLEAVRLRGELLWWQQSRYSPSLEVGYGDLDGPADVAVAAAFDLHQLVPSIAPVAAEHVLAGLVGAVTASEPVPLAQLQEAKSAARLPNTGVGLTPATLLTAITSGTDSVRPPAFGAWTEQTPQRTAVVLFRDLQAAAALRTPPS
jgi:GTPase-associated system helical domain